MITQLVGYLWTQTKYFIRTRSTYGERSCSVFSDNVMSWFRSSRSSELLRTRYRTRSRKTSGWSWSRSR